MAAPATASSPDGLQLRSKPTISARVNRKAIFVLGGVLAAIVVFVLTNISKSEAGGGKASSEKARTRILSAESDAAKITGSVSDSAPRVAPPPPEVPALEPSGSPVSTQPGKPGQPSAEDKELGQALRSDTALVRFIAPAPAAEATSAPPVLAPRRDRDSRDALEPAREEPDQNRQEQKREFLERALRTKSPPYTIVRPQPPVTEFEIKTGSIIPALLVTAINSDLPGEIVAQVSQNVFDSATGKHLLIPQGTKLYGQYSSDVAFGQERLMVTWSRLIYPNASTIEMGGMAGIDKQGQSGFGDRVNNHWMRTFGAAILTSLFTAGVQLSQPQAANATELTTQQVAAASLGQQMGRFGMAVAARNLRVQPTIEIRRGHQFAVMVSKDMVFGGPYEDKPQD